MLYSAKLQNLWENIIISFDFFTILIKELPNGRSKLSKFDLNRSEKLGCINEFLLLQLKMSNSAFMSVCIVDDERVPHQRSPATISLIVREMLNQRQVIFFRIALSVGINSYRATRNNRIHFVKDHLPKFFFKLLVRDTWISRTDDSQFHCNLLSDAGSSRLRVTLYPNPLFRASMSM